MRSKPQGTLLFEVCLVLSLVCAWWLGSRALGGWGFVEVVRHWEWKITELQKERLSYDGICKWK